MIPPDGAPQLRLVPAQTDSPTVTVEGPLVHRCPFVKEDDVGTVELSWVVTNGMTLELHTLREWLDAFVDVEITHEALTVRILEAVGAAGVTVGQVHTTWSTAGMTVRVTAG